MKRFLTKAFEQGFIAVCAAMCLSPMFLLAIFGYFYLILALWAAVVVITFVLGGFVDWVSPADEEPYYIHD